MMTLSLFTEKQIFKSEVEELILSNFTELKVENNSDNQLFLGKSPRSLNIMFNEGCRVEDEDCFFEKSFLDSLTIKNPYYLDVGYHKPEFTRKLVAILIKKYPEMIIFDDDYMWLGSAEEYIKLDYQSPNSNYCGPNYPCK